MIRGHMEGYSCPTGQERRKVKTLDYELTACSFELYGGYQLIILSFSRWHCKKCKPPWDRNDHPSAPARVASRNHSVSSCLLDNAGLTGHYKIQHPKDKRMSSTSRLFLFIGPTSGWLSPVLLQTFGTVATVGLEETLIVNANSFMPAGVNSRSLRTGFNLCPIKVTVVD